MMPRTSDPDKFGEPDPQTGLSAKGWSRKKIRELEPLFEQLSYEQIARLLDIFSILFTEDSIETMSKDAILWTIADDWTYEELKEEIEKMLAQKPEPIESESKNISYHLNQVRYRNGTR